MQGSPRWLNLAALGASLLSLVMASGLAIRQTRTSRNASQVPVLLDLIYHTRTLEFRRNEQDLWVKLKDYDASRGVSGLPDDIRDRALETALFYQHLAYLVAFKIVDHDLAVLPVHNRLRKSWNALEPFVLAERSLGATADYLSEFQFLAASVDEKKMQTLSHSIGRKVFKISG